jgi:hypothetical protein
MRKKFTQRDPDDEAEESARDWAQYDHEELDESDLDDDGENDE